MESPSLSFTVQSEASRPLADFAPTLWENPLTTFSVSNSAYETYIERLNVLKEKVEELMMASKANPTEIIKFIDALCRLAVAYHFETEIAEQLEQIFSSHDFNDMIRGDEYDLCTVGLMFQVFRQFAYKISSDVFGKFKSEDGKFKEFLGADARGMLSLYEAAHWSMHGEDILDEAMAFARSHLEGLASRSSHHLALRIKNALKHPYHRGISRIEMRQYISYYKEEESHNKTLLELAKLDFNLLQLLHCEELTRVSRWHKDLEIASKFPHVRNRIVEAYLWSVGVYFEPRYSRARIILTKIIIIATLLDDTYDAYATFEELDLFTCAIDRWHPRAVDQLPDYMKYLYQIILDFYDELEEELVKEGRSECVSYAKNAVNQRLPSRGKVVARRLYAEGYMPTFEEYTTNGHLSSGHYLVAAGSFLGMADVGKRDAFEWLSSMPKLLISSETICRFTDDITDHEFENKRKHVPTAIRCYVKNYGVSEHKAIEVLESLITKAWKNLNEALMRPHPLYFPVLVRIFNITRVIDVFFKYQDGYTNPAFLKDYIVSLFIENVPI